MTTKNEERVSDIGILAALEAMAAALPWDTIEIWVKRYPKGDYGYTAYINPNDELGFPSNSRSAGDLDGLVRDVIETCAGARRDPEAQRAKKLEELREHIRKLEAVQIGSPPYVPNRELAEYNKARAPLDVASEVSSE